MYLPVALLVLAATASASCFSKSECPETIETELPQNLDEYFLGVWYDVYYWGTWARLKADLDCVSFEVVEASPEDVQTMKERCEGTDLVFDWDNVHLKINDRPESWRLLGIVQEEAKLLILDFECYAIELVVHKVSDTEDTAVAVGKKSTELLVRNIPEQEELDCLVDSIDVVKDYPWGWGICSPSANKKQAISTRQKLDKYLGMGI